VQGYVSLALDYALNASGVPSSVLSNADVVAGVLAGNATQVLRGLASEYGLPAWSADAVIALSSGARPAPRGLASLLSGSSASSRLSSLLVQYNVSGELAALGLGSEYDTAVSEADVRTIAMLISSVGTLTSGRRLSSAGQTALGEALGRVVLVVSTATQLRVALEENDPGLAVSAVVAASGESHSPIGRSLEAVVKASSLATTAQSASTIPELAAVVGSAMELLPLDQRASSALVGLATVGSLATQLLSAATADPPNVTAALRVSVTLARELGAPAWVVTGLEKVVGVAAIAPRLIAAVQLPDVPAAVIAVVEMGAVVAGTGDWVSDALRDLLVGDVSGAYATLSPHLQPAVLYSALSNLPSDFQISMSRSSPSGGSSPMAGIVKVASAHPAL
jgi:hypothetical protein